MSKNRQTGELINYISVNESGNVVLSNGHLVATQNYVSTALANLVDSAPTTLDTLNELAAALGDDPNFATTVATSIGGKLSLTGGTLTGPLNGTSAVFTGSVTSDDLILTAGTLFGTGNTGFSNRASDTTLYLQMPATGFNITDNALNTRFILSSTGVATFDTTAAISAVFNSTNASGGYIVFRRSGTSIGYLGNSAQLGQGVLNAFELRADNNLFLTTTSGLLTMTSAGNVGIGTASPSNLLDISTPITNSFFGLNLSYIGSSVGVFQVNNSTGELKIGGNSAGYFPTFYAAGSERMRITSGGYLKAKGTESTYYSVGELNHELRTGVGDNWITYFTNTSGSPYGLRIVYPSSAPNNSDNWPFYFNDLNATRFGVQSNGNVVNQNGSYGSFSDIKLKENIEDATPKLDDLLKVKVRNYNLIGDNKKQIGVIAQELEEVFPAMIEESEDFEEVEVPQLDEEGNEVLNEEGEVVTIRKRVSKGTTTKSVKYSVFVPMLIKAIQELKTEIDSLKNQIK
jgi:hypothetical protein